MGLRSSTGVGLVLAAVGGLCFLSSERGQRLVRYCYERHVLVNQFHRAACESSPNAAVSRVSSAAVILESSQASPDDSPLPKSITAFQAGPPKTANIFMVDFAGTFLTAHQLTVEVPPPSSPTGSISSQQDFDDDGPDDGFTYELYCAPLAIEERRRVLSSQSSHYWIPPAYRGSAKDLLRYSALCFAEMLCSPRLNTLAPCNPLTHENVTSLFAPSPKRPPTIELPLGENPRSRSPPSPPLPTLNWSGSLTPKEAALAQQISVEMLRPASGKGQGNSEEESLVELVLCFSPSWERHSARSARGVLLAGKAGQTVFDLLGEGCRHLRRDVRVAELMNEALDSLPKGHTVPSKGTNTECASVYSRLMHELRQGLVSLLPL